MSRRSQPARHHGYLIVDKPAGITSHDVVSIVRRMLGERRVGHAGTLDPAATGVLPLAVGLATRTVEYLSEASKGYRAEIVFGVTTDSCDRDGLLLEETSTDGLLETALFAAVNALRGPQLQIPPMHSAIKVDGKRLYSLAREGQELSLKARSVVFHQLNVVSWHVPRLVIDVECSKGTYIRSLARDLGAAVGTGAYLASLIRTRTGPFAIGDAHPLDHVPSLLKEHGWRRLAFHPDRVMWDLPLQVLDQQETADWADGKIIANRTGAEGAIRVYDCRGVWVGVGRATADTCKPEKVVHVSNADMSGRRD